jgi:hypothetical protein
VCEPLPAPTAQNQRAMLTHWLPSRRGSLVITLLPVYHSAMSRHALLGCHGGGGGLGGSAGGGGLGGGGAVPQLARSVTGVYVVPAEKELNVDAAWPSCALSYRSQ